MTKMKKLEKRLNEVGAKLPQAAQIDLIIEGFDKFWDSDNDFPDVNITREGNILFDWGWDSTSFDFDLDPVSMQGTLTMRYYGHDWSPGDGPDETEVTDFDLYKSNDWVSLFMAVCG